MKMSLNKRKSEKNDWKIEWKIVQIRRKKKTQTLPENKYKEKNKKNKRNKNKNWKKQQQKTIKEQNKKTPNKTRQQK